MMSYIDKKKLTGALRQQFPVDTANNLHCRGQCLKDNLLIQALYVKGIGSVPIPISHQNIQKLVEGVAFTETKGQCVTQHSPLLTCKNLLAINLTSTAQTSLLDQAVSSVKNLTGVSLGEELNITMKKLWMCTTKKQCCKKTSNIKMPGTKFGKFIVLIPVEGGYEGGRLKVEKTDENVTFFDFCNLSNQCFSCAAFFSDCKHLWEPVERGNMVALEYDLIWRPSSARVTSSISLPNFLKALNLAKQALRPWEFNSSLESKKIMEEKQTVANDETNLKQQPNPKLPKEEKNKGADHYPNSEVSPIVKEHPLSCVPDAPKDHLFIIPLIGTYYESNFNFASLHEGDRQMAHILQSIDFIDVHLAIVSQNQNPQRAYDGLHVAQWFYSSLSIPQFQQCHLDMTNQLLGQLETNLISNINMEPIPRHAVIVIQPRHQSIRRCCTFQFNAMLDYLESRISSDGDSKILRMRSVASFGQTISYCREEPMKVWDVSADTAAERTLRLLKLGRDLKAEKESLSLIELLAQDFIKSPVEGFPKSLSNEIKSQVFYEGIRNELVAQSIVKTALDFGRTKRIFAAPMLRQLISANRLRQLKSFSALVLVLLRKDCVQEAISVANRIFTVLSQNVAIVQTFDQSQIDAYVDAVVALEIRPGAAANEESLLKRLVVPVFSKLGFYQQCCLLVNLQKSSGKKMESSPSCLAMFEVMCLMLLRRGLCSSGRVVAMVSDVVAFFVKRGNKHIFKIFLDHVFWRKDITGVEFNSHFWLEEVIAVVASSSFAKDALIECLNKRIDSVKTIVLEPPSREENLKRAELVRFFLVVLRLERSPQLADPARMELLIQTIVFTMPHNRLVHLAVDLLEKGSVQMKELPSGKRLLLNIGYALLARDCSSFQNEPPIRPVVDILKCFLAFTREGSDSVKQFIQLICRCDKWVPRNKNLLIAAILESPEMWSGYSSKFEMAAIARQCLMDLMTSWIAGLVQIIEVPSSDLRTNIAACFLCFVREERKNQTFGNVVVEPFSRLFSKMAPQQLANLIWDVYKADANELPSLMKITATLKLYTDLCRRLVGRKDPTFASFFQLWKTKSPAENMLIELTSSLLWLGDGQCIKDLGAQLSILYPDGPNDAILQLIKSEEIQQLTDSLPQARDSFRRLLGYRVSFLNENLEIEAASVWRMPDASLPDHPVVETFLHSSSEKMAYSNFCSKDQALKFANFLSSLGTINGYSLRSVVTGQSFNSKCEIDKVKTHDVNVFANKALREEKANLEKIILSLQQRKRNDNNPLVESSDVGNVADNNDVLILASPPKKPKTDILLIDLTI